MRLRLALAQGSLALELAVPVMVGPVMVRELAVRLSDVRFPVDLSGGVERFRHRRGQLSRGRVELRFAEVGRFLTRLWRNQLGQGPIEVTVAAAVGGAMIGAASDTSAIAFEVLLAPLCGDLRILVDGARGLGLAAPPHLVALRLMGLAMESEATRAGGALVVRDLPGRIARALLPDAGARAPSSAGVEVTLQGPDEATSVELLFAAAMGTDAAGGQRELHDRTLRALETAQLAGDGDLAAIAGDFDAARAAYLHGLELAPRHPELAMRLAALDLFIGGRADAALSTLVEVASAIDAGTVGAEALAACHDPEGAYTALARAAAKEAYGVLAARMWLRAADFGADPRGRQGALDAALVRAPGLATARWARLCARLSLGDAAGARADAEHVEAAARGADARAEAAARAGALFAEQGYAADAQRCYERALRYRPTNEASVLGLGRAFRELGRGARALDLFARAVSLSERRGSVNPAASLELARALVEVAGDRSAAIARLASIGPEAPEAPEARLAEARYRVELGDRVGASRALARLRHLAEAVVAVGIATSARVPAILIEGAELEEQELGDLPAAERALSLAVRLAPNDPRAARALRRVARMVAPEPVKAEPLAPVPPEARRPAAAAAAPVDTDDEGDVDRLTDALRANPGDAAITARLARLLGKLDRDLELLALLSARLDEAPESGRDAASADRDRVLEKLARTADAEGRPDEALLYRSMATARR